MMVGSLTPAQEEAVRAMIARAIAEAIPAIVSQIRADVVSASRRAQS